MYDVLCIGSATVDHFLTTEHSLKDVKLGDKVLVKDMESHTGGGATNSAVALSKLGLKVKILTKIGTDHNSEFISKELEEHKIQNICLKKSRRNTDNATIISSIKEKDRVIYVYKGASQKLNMADFKVSKLKTRWIYLATVMGQSLTTAKQIAKYAQKKKIKLLFNPSLYLAEKGKAYLKDILLATDLLVLNRAEAKALLKTTTNSIQKMLAELKKLGPNSVIITHGPNSSYAINDNKVYSLVPPKIKVVHTAGAGDAFTSGVLAGIVKKFSFEDCLRLGQVNANSVIQQIGTKNKLLLMREAQPLMKKIKVKC